MMNKLRAMFDDQPTKTMLSLMEVDMSKPQDDYDELVFTTSDYHNKLIDSYIGYKPAIYDTIDYAPYHRDIVYIHKTNCPNCGGLLDGDEHSPYVKCACCGAKIWSEREVS